MIQFNGSGSEESFNLRIERFSKEDYVDVVKSLLFFLRNNNPQNSSCSNETHFLCWFIEEMLPDADQIINKEEFELFKKFKQQHKKAV